MRSDILRPVIFRPVIFRSFSDLSCDEELSRGHELNYSEHLLRNVRNHQNVRNVNKIGQPKCHKTKMSKNQNVKKSKCQTKCSKF